MQKLHPLTEKALFDSFIEANASKHSRILLAALRTSTLTFSDITVSHPLSDDWQDFGRLALEKFFSTARGFVYVLTSAQYPETIKVGLTSKSPEQRVQRLNNESVIWHFHCEGAVATHDRRQLESAVHRHLRTHGVPHQKEFFRYDPHEGLALIEALQQRDVTLLRSRVPGILLPI